MAQIRRAKFAPAGIAGTNGHGLLGDSADATALRLASAEYLKRLAKRRGGSRSNTSSPQEKYNRQYIMSLKYF